MLRTWRIWYSLLMISTLIVLGHALYPHIHHGTHIHSPLAAQDGWLRLLHQLFGTNPGQHHLEVCAEDEVEACTVPGPLAEDEHQDQASDLWTICCVLSSSDRLWDRIAASPALSGLFEDILLRRTSDSLPMRAPPYLA